ncbi:MAG: hypothetical protein R3B41_03925 [Candidatus Doudnabacteria bacterium]
MDQNQQNQSTQEQMLQEILENTRKTRNYIKWSVIITIAFVVLPLVGAVIALPIMLNSLTQVYSGLGV